MKPELIVLIILTSASFLTLLLSPIISCGIEFSRRVEKSSCCGSNMELKVCTRLKLTILKIY